MRREHWLRFIDLSAGAEETSARKPPSESRHAPRSDRVVNLSKFLGDRAKVATITKSGKHLPHWSSCSTYNTSK